MLHSSEMAIQVWNQQFVTANLDNVHAEHFMLKFTIVTIECCHGRAF